MQGLTFFSKNDNGWLSNPGHFVVLRDPQATSLSRYLGPSEDYDSFDVFLGRQGSGPRQKTSRVHKGSAQFVELYAVEDALVSRCLIL